MNRARLGVLALALSMSLPLPAQAQGMGGMGMKGMEHNDMKKAEPQSHHAVGVVKAVDATKGTVSVQHGAVPSLQWPAMTMSFKAHDRKMLEQLKPGAKVEFDFVQRGKDYFITKIR